MKTKFPCQGTEHTFNSVKDGTHDRLHRPITCHVNTLIHVHARIFISIIYVYVCALAPIHGFRQNEPLSPFIVRRNIPSISNALRGEKGESSPGQRVRRNGIRRNMCSPAAVYFSRAYYFLILFPSNMIRTHRSTSLRKKVTSGTAITSEDSGVQLF